jgi:hypothetical protein
MNYGGEVAVSVDGEWDEDRWRAESDMETLVRAKEIKDDPERFRAAMDFAREKREELKGLDD